MVKFWFKIQIISNYFKRGSQRVVIYPSPSVRLKESYAACHADLDFPSVLCMGTKDGSTLFSGEKPTGGGPEASGQERGCMEGPEEGVLRGDFIQTGVMSRGEWWAYPPCGPCLLHIHHWRICFKTRLTLRWAQWTKTAGGSRMARTKEGHGMAGHSTWLAGAGSQQWGKQMLRSCAEGRAYPANKRFLTQSKKQD